MNMLQASKAVIIIIIMGELKRNSYSAVITHYTAFALTFPGYSRVIKY